MAACTTRIGKIIVRTCGHPATGACAQCGAQCCDRHRSSIGLCPACAGTTAADAWYGDPAVTELTFTPAEIAAFDEVGDFDRTGGGDVYDS